MVLPEVSDTGRKTHTFPGAADTHLMGVRTDRAWPVAEAPCPAALLLGAEDREGLGG